MQKCDADTPRVGLEIHVWPLADLCTHFPLQASASAQGRDTAPSSHRECSAASRLPSLCFSSSVASYLRIPLLPTCRRIPLQSGSRARGGDREGHCSVHCDPSARLHRLSCFAASLSRGFSGSTKPSAVLTPKLTLSPVSHRRSAFLSCLSAALLVQVFFRFLVALLLCSFSPPGVFASSPLHVAPEFPLRGNSENLLFKFAPWTAPAPFSSRLFFFASALAFRFENHEGGWGGGATAARK